jgi:hypothetical protein
MVAIGERLFAEPDWPRAACAALMKSDDLVD